MKKFIIENFKDKKIRERLLFLHQKGLEDEEDLLMQQASLEAFLMLYASKISLNKFDIVLGSNGTIGIGWRKSSDNLINIELINEKDNYFIMYKPKENPINKLDKIRIVKRESITNIIKILKNIDWILD